MPKINSYEQIARQVLMTGDPVTGTDGRLYLDGTMTPVVLARAMAEAIYVGEIFRDGQSVTQKYTVGAKVGDAIRVPLETPYPNSSRTLALGGRNGTPGNAGTINVKPPYLPSDSEFVLFMNQVNDTPLLFPEISKDWMPFNTVAKRISGFAKGVVEDRSASILAEIIAYNAYRALNGGNNIQTITTTEDNAYGTLINDLHTALSDGDLVTNAHTYDTVGRTIIGRPGFVNGMFNRNSGVILTGSDIAQTMLKEYTFDTELADRNYVGNAYKGSVMGFDIVECANFIWSRAEKYLGLEAGALDHVLAIAVSKEATAVAPNIDLGFKMIDANEVRGLKGQPLNCWGMEAFRKIQLIGDTTLSVDSLKTAGFSESVRLYPIAPNAVDKDSAGIQVPVLDINGKVVAYKTIAKVPNPNGGNIQSSVCRVTLAVFGTDDAALNGATVTVSAPTGITVVNNNDGTYTFNVPQYSAVTVSVANSGYTTQQVNLTSANTKTALYSKVVNLVASA